MYKGKTGRGRKMEAGNGRKEQTYIHLGHADPGMIKLHLLPLGLEVKLEGLPRRPDLDACPVLTGDSYQEVVFRIGVGRPAVLHEFLDHDLDSCGHFLFFIALFFLSVDKKKKAKVRELVVGNGATADERKLLYLVGRQAWVDVDGFEVGWTV